MRLLSYGADAVLVEVDDVSAALQLTDAIRRTPLPDLIDTVPGAQTVLLVFEPDRRPADLERRLSALDPDAATAGHPAVEVVRIPAVYDGPDLSEVADRLGLAPAEVVRRHTGVTWTVAFCGFAPGFGYLLGADDLRVPRRETPRTRVPAGAIGLADRWSGVYPRSGPGGWQLIGHTDAVLWDLDTDPPARLRPGVEVRFLDRTSALGLSSGDDN